MPYKDKEIQKEKNREYQKRHYAKNKSYYKTKAKERRKNLRQWFKDYRKELKCSKCGEDHVACLDFHHIDSEKEFSISRAVATGIGPTRIEKEIERCIVVCSNCHRKLHYDAGWSSGSSLGS